MYDFTILLCSVLAFAEFEAFGFKGFYNVHKPPVISAPVCLCGVKTTSPKELHHKYLHGCKGLKV